jgi:signal transduction histidine kinase
MSSRIRGAGAALLYAGGWSVLALFSASQSILTYSYAGTGAVNRAAVLKVTLPLWYLWAVLTPAIWYAARRWPIGPGAWKRHVTLHIGLNIGFVLIVVALYRVVRGLLGIPSRNPFGFEVITGLHAHVLTYWIVVGVSHIGAYYRRARDREVHAAALMAELSVARLDALRMQLHPHFLFNTMHAISSAVREDPEGAENMLAELAELLRTTVDGAGTNEVSVRDELAFIRRYVGIQQVRFGERLQVEIDVAAEAEDAAVPSLLLQPLVENAIEHGIARRLQGGTLSIRVRMRDDAVEVSVSDDGQGLQRVSGRPEAERVGLRNTRARLAHMYGDGARLDLLARTGGGVSVVVTLPYHTLDPVPA